MFVEILLFVIIVLFVTYQKTKKPPNMPPGPYGLPIIGKLPPRNVPITSYLRQLKQKYGKIFSTKWGGRVMVFLADPQVIRKALNHPDLQRRPSIYSFEIFSFFLNKGVIFANDSVWKDNRRFLLHNLRNLGMGKTRLEDSIMEEVEMLTKYLEKNCLNKETELDWSINVAVLNVIWQMLAGVRYEGDDDRIIMYNKMVAENFEIMQGPVFFIDNMPWLLNVIPTSVLNWWTRVDIIMKNRDTFFAQCKETILEHKKTLDPENPRDIVDHYLLDMVKEKDNSTVSDADEYLDLIILMSDMFAAGSETTSTTLRWMTLFLALNVDVQKKSQEALDIIVPRDRLPSLDDRDKLAYIDAMLLEVMRSSSLLLMGVPHSGATAVQLEGYTIPEDTMILPCMELCHKDPAFWEKPEEFYPEHFLDKDGKLDSKKEAFMPFSTGRRQCLGESLARMELFLFAAAILQKFSISAPPGAQLTTESDPSNQLLRQPYPFKVILKKRM